MTSSPMGREPPDSGPEPELSKELLAAYLSTVVLLRSDDRWCEWSDAEPESGEPVYVITACNPYSEQRGPRENEAANAKLKTALDVAELPYRAALGQSPDQQWQEASFAVAGWSREEARRWGRAFGQHAVFEIRGDELSVVECRTGSVHRVLIPGEDGSR